MKAMEETNKKCQKGLENMEDFATLLGIRKEQIGEEENKLGRVGSVDGHDLMEVTEEDKGDGTSQGTSQVKPGQKEEKGKSKCKSWVKNGFTYSLGIIALLSIFTISCSEATKPMICHRGDKSNLVKFTYDTTECSKSAKFLGMNMHSDNLEIFRPNTQSFIFDAWQCLKIKQAVQFRTDILNYHYQNKPEQKFMKVSEEECKEWINFKRCEIGELNGDGKEYSTNYKLEINYKYFSAGWQISEATNCFLRKIKLIGKPGKAKIDSLTEQVQHCNFRDHSCKILAGGVILWEEQKEVYELYDARTCTYTSAGIFAGNYTEGIWYSHSTQRAMIFDENSQSIETCGHKLRVSNTGLAVSEENYQAIITRTEDKLGNKANRFKRQTQTDEYVTESELMSRMQASAVYEQQATKFRLENIVQIICKSIIVGQKSTQLSNLEATLLVREKLGNEYLQAEWISLDMLDYWPCVPVNVSFRIMNEGICYQDIPINVTVGSEIESAFIEPITLIIKSKSEQGDCDRFRHRIVLIDNEIVKIDQWTGEIRKINKNEVKIEKISIENMNPIKNVDLHVLNRDKLNNLTRGQIDLLQLLHPLLGDRRFDEGKSNIEISNRGSWFNANSNTNWSIGSFFLGLDYWEFIERGVCIWFICGLLWKIWLWKQKRVTKQIIREQNTKNFFAGSVAECHADSHNKLGNIKMEVPRPKVTGRNETSIEMDIELEEEPEEKEEKGRTKRKRRWY
jgi:hypothetical protein